MMIFHLADWFSFTSMEDSHLLLYFFLQYVLNSRLMFKCIYINYYCLSYHMSRKTIFTD